VPSPLELDLVDGSAWIGLTPFRVERMRAFGAIPVSIRSTFPETNLRTYVRAPDGRDGIYFLSIDVPTVANVAGGRIAGVAYHLAAMAVDGKAGIRYRSRRRGADAHHDIRVRPGAAITDAQLPPTVASLVGRWRAYTRTAGLMTSVPVQHEAWPMHEADLLAIDETVLRVAGLPAPDGPPLVHWSPGVHARLGRPRRMRDLVV
jgi:uncharacterized protein YqjF (DUF2071 family)